MPWLLLHVLSAFICSSIQQIFIECLLWTRSTWQCRWKAYFRRILLSVARKIEEAAGGQKMSGDLKHSKGWKKCRLSERIRGFIVKISKGGWKGILLKPFQSWRTWIPWTKPRTRVLQQDKMLRVCLADMWHWVFFSYYTADLILAIILLIILLL
jgi:hypothetical protein